MPSAPTDGGGLTDYDILQSLLTGQSPSYSAPALQVSAA